MIPHVPPTFGAAALAPLLPFLVFVAGASLVLLIDALAGRRRLPWAWIAVPVPLLALIAAAARLAAGGGPAIAGDPAILGGATVFGGQFVEDAFGLFVTVVIAMASLFAVVLSDVYLRRMERYRGDYFALILFSAGGMCLFASSTDLISLFLGLELLSIPVYILSGFLRRDPKSVEAAMKYFLLGAFSSAVFLLGGALVYAGTGSTDLAVALRGGFDPGARGLVLAGGLLLLAGFLFKTAAVPFHMWTPDVYEGAPTAVTAFMAAAVKAAAFGALARALIVAGPSGISAAAAGFLWWVALLTMTVGNLAAIVQLNVKRMLAYSSIAHAGYMLVGLAVFAATGSRELLAAVLFYLLGYAFMNLGAFAVVILWGGEKEERLEISDWAGMGWKSPAAAAALSLFMIALAGIPPTAGFFGKYLLFRGAVNQGFVSLVVLAALNSAVSVYYYFRVLVSLYMRPATRPMEYAPSVAVGAVIAACAIGVLWLGILPEGLRSVAPVSLIGLVREAVAAVP
jgi:NADH-quinone oxidoreductase subunit N